MGAVILVKLTVAVSLICCYSSAYNTETNEVLSLYLRNGGKSETHNASLEPAYAGYSFDAKMDDGVARLIVGQPREGDGGSIQSPGAIFYCNITSSFVAPNNNSSLVNCTKLDIFDQTSFNGRGFDHNTAADAMGLSLGRFGGNQYAVCTPLRQRKCPSGTNYIPGACYYGNPNEPYWNFLKWNETTTCIDKIIEVIFVVDGSKSIGDQNFVTVKKWLINVTASLMLKFGEALRTEVLQYSDQDRLASRVDIEKSKKFVIPYTLNDRLTIEQIKEKILNMPYLEKTTYTTYALKRVMEVEFHRSEVKDRVSHRIIVVLTDGKADDSTKMLNWYDTHGNNVIVFAVGVGDLISETQLRRIANGDTSNERVLQVKNFDQLQSHVNSLTSDIKSVISLEDSGGNSDRTPEQDIENAQLGTSIASTRDGQVLFGAVGMYRDSGSVMQKNTSSDFNPKFLSYQAVTNGLPTRTDDSYMGYSVMTGLFDGPESSEYIATGAPRYLLRGAVVVYKSTNDGPSMNDSVTIMAPDNRLQMASYFGGCILTVDVNGDGKDDLFIGAPLFVGTNYDEGRVFVYISQKSANSPQSWADASYLPYELFGDNAQSGRFGTAMANAGDLNLDGFNDVVIGAPLADSGKGVVFVYHGKKEGIDDTISQKIYASSFGKTTLKYFGQSLQGNIDVDGNQYPDLLIGAPGSDSVVILRSRPIVKILADITFGETTIGIFECIGRNYKNCTSITVCFQVNGTSIESSIEIDFALSLDTGKKTDAEKRLEFRNSSSAISRSLNISKVEHCFTENLNVKKQLADFDTLINANMTFDLASSHKAVSFSSVRDISIPNSLNASTRFAKQCRNDTCASDLKLSAEIIVPLFKSDDSSDLTENGMVVIVAEQTAKNPARVKVNLTNSGENSFDTRVNVTTSKISVGTIKTLSAHPSTSSCITKFEPDSSGSQTVFRYNSGEGIMRPGSWVSVNNNDNLKQNGELESQTVNITAFSKYEYPRYRNIEGVSETYRSHRPFRFVCPSAVHPSQSSAESFSSDNFWEVTRRIKYISDLTLRKKWSKEDIELNYTTVKKNITSIHEIGENTTDVEMDFRISGSGYSNIPSSEITLKWPWLTKEGKPLLYLFKLDCQAQGSSSCSCDQSLINLYNLTLEKPNENNTNGNYVEISPPQYAIEDSSFDCFTDGEKNFTCETVRCTINNLYQTDHVIFQAYFRLWSSTITFKGSGFDTDELELRSLFRVNANKSQYIIDKNGRPLVKSEEIISKAKKYTKSLPPATSEDFLWVYILAAAGGVLLLTALVIILWKVGFFKSKYADMKKNEEDELADATEFRQNGEGFQADMKANKEGRSTQKQDEGAEEEAASRESLPLNSGIDTEKEIHPV